MSTATALLNQMASAAASASASGSPHNTRKRHRESLGADSSPSKRRVAAVETKETQADTHTAKPAHSLPRQSRTRLSRPSLPLPASPAPAPRRGAQQFEVPESPKKTRGKETEPVKPREMPKKTMRKVGQKKAQTQSPFKGMGFEGLGELNSGAMLTSSDSPAKNTRSRPKNPLEVLRLRNLQRQDGSGAHPQKQGRSQKPASGAAEEQDGPGPTKETPRMRSQDKAVSEELAVENENPGNKDTESIESQTDVTDEDETDGPGHQLRQETRQMVQQQTQPKKATPSKRGQMGERRDISGRAALRTSTSHDRSKLAAVQQRERSPAPPEDEENIQETEESATEPDQPQPSQRRRGQTAISQEERQARREAEARKRAENALETEAAELAGFEKRAQKFVHGIEDTVESIGGIEAWSKMGAGAKTITAMVSRKMEMETERCQSVWRQVRKLSKWFKGLEEASEEEVAQTLRSLQERATWKHLSRDGATGRGDYAVLEIYQYLIPQSVYLIRNALKGRFYTNYKQSWQEILMLVNITLSLCNAASEWMPRPSTLEGGIRREVRNHIRPGLEHIREAVQAHLDMLELKERNTRKAEELRAAQRRARLMRQKQWEALQARMSSCRLSTTSKPQQKRPTYAEEVVDVDELDDEAAYHSMGGKASQPQARIARQATEEIPAPDPIVTWTEQEQIALLNGLQRFRGTDRYDRILETSVELNMKDIDQCMARARYHKQACRQLLADEAVKGGLGYDWLRSV